MNHFSLCFLPHLPLNAQSQLFHKHNNVLCVFSEGLQLSHLMSLTSNFKVEDVSNYQGIIQTSWKPLIFSSSNRGRTLQTLYGCTNNDVALITYDSCRYFQPRFAAHVGYFLWSNEDTSDNHNNICFHIIKQKVGNHLFFEFLWVKKSLEQRNNADAFLSNILHGWM